MVSRKKKVLGVAALTAAAAVGAAKFGSRKSTGKIATIVTGKRCDDGDRIGIKDDSHQKLVEISVPWRTGEDFELGENVTYVIDRNPRHKVNGVHAGSIAKLD